MPNITTVFPTTAVKFPRGDKPYPQVVKNIGFAVLPLIIFVSIIGNSLVIHLTRKREILKGLMKAFVINIAICNIVLCVFPFLYLVELGTNEWHFGSVGCDVLVVLEYTVLTSANLSLVHIALERLFAIVKPFKMRLGQKSASVLLIVAWLVGLPLAIPFVILQPRYVDDDHPNAAAQPECNNMWAVTTIGMPTQSLVYYTVMFCVLYIIPAVFIGVCYVKVMYVMLVKIKRPGNQTTESKKLDQQRKLRTVKLLFATVIIFKVFWLPSYIQEFLLAGGVEDLKDNVRIQVINLICASLGYTYCAVTPFLYFIFNEQYKAALKELSGTLRFTLKSGGYAFTTPKSCRKQVNRINALEGGELDSTPMNQRKSDQVLINNAAANGP